MPVLAQRAQEKTTPPPTLEKETIGVNPHRAASEGPRWMRAVRRPPGCPFEGHGQDRWEVRTHREGEV